MININNLSYRYKNGYADALQDVTTSIGQGIHLLLGENGAGKSTLLHLIGGLRTPMPHQLFINDVDTGRFRRLPSVQSTIAFLDNDMELPGKTIHAIAHCQAQFYPRFDNEMLDANLAAFGLDRYTLLGNLSMGNRRKAYVAYMLALRAEILLLDEPTNGLDIESKQAVQSLLARCIDENQTVIISTHNFADLQNLYEGLIVLAKGHLVLNASTERIADRLIFGTIPVQPADALYWELAGGAYQGIWDAASPEAPAGGPIDFRLLYSAMHSRFAPSVSACLQCPEPSQNAPIDHVEPDNSDSL